MLGCIRHVYEKIPHKTACFSGIHDGRDENGLIAIRVLMMLLNMSEPMEVHG